MLCKVLMFPFQLFYYFQKHALLETLWRNALTVDLIIQNLFCFHVQVHNCVNLNKKACMINIYIYIYLITQGNISWSKDLLNPLGPTSGQTLGHLGHQAEPWGIRCFIVPLGTGVYRITFYSWCTSVWQHPAKGLDKGIFLTKVSLSVMLLRYEIFTDLQELQGSCKADLF